MVSLPRRGDGFRVQRLHFPTFTRIVCRPQIYLPPGTDGPNRCRRFIYMCGHCQQSNNGVASGQPKQNVSPPLGFGSRETGTRVGIVDTIQWLLSEFAGHHHRDVRDGRWWWNIEATHPPASKPGSGIRGNWDYLRSREEVDAGSLWHHRGRSVAAHIRG